MTDVLSVIALMDFWQGAQFQGSESEVEYFYQASHLSYLFGLSKTACMHW